VASLDPEAGLERTHFNDLISFRDFTVEKKPKALEKQPRDPQRAELGRSVANFVHVATIGGEPRSKQRVRGIR
jgi:hypothetical protein